MDDKKQKLILYILLFSILIFDTFLFIWVFGIILSWGETIISGVISAVGAIIGGSLTLIGVMWTISYQRKIYYRAKYENANYVFTELLPLINQVYNHIKSLNPKSFSQEIDEIKNAAKKLEGKTKDLLLLASQSDSEFFREVKNIEFYSGVIFEYIDGLVGIETDNEIKDKLMIYYNGLAKADSRFDKILSNMKKISF
ncbi:hypothetical protein [Salinibacillus aidingensis]